MGIAVLALIIAVAAGCWLLLRLAGGQGGQPQGADARSMTILKGVVLLVLTAALFAAKLWPLAFMVLLAVGGVAAIEALRGGGDGELSDEAPRSTELPARRMTVEEALSILGLDAGASADDIRTAHRKLIAQLHPDKGGTDYLAAKINQARDHLLKTLEGS